MSFRLRKTVYLCRAAECKHKNAVYERITEDNGVLETAVAWKGRCSGCGRGSFDVQYQAVLDRPIEDAFLPSA